MKKLLLFISVLSIASSSFAATNLTATSKASATLSTSCSLTMGSVVFGTITPGQASSTTSNTLNVVCSNGLAYTFGTTHPTDGTDCPYMIGQTKSDKLYYFIKSGSSWLANGLALGRVSAVGTGSNQAYNLQGVILPSGVPASYGCAGKNPTANYGFNPYVIPDTYYTTANMVITF